MITIVIASYKYGHLASQAIESVLAQTVKPTRILFVDDGIGDCKHLPALYPEVEYVLRETNLGTVANFQDMLMRANTKYTLFLGADNWLRSDAVEQLLAEAEREGADIVTYDIQVTGELRDEIRKRHGGELTAYLGDLYWDRSSGHHGSMLYNTKLAQTVGYSSPAGRTVEDMVLYQKMLSIGAKRVHLSKPLLIYRRHRENFNPCK